MARNVRVVTGPRPTGEVGRAQELADALTVRALRSRAPEQGGPVQVAMSPWEGVAQLGEAWIAGRVRSRADELAAAQREGQQSANRDMVEALTRNEAPRRLDAQGRPTGAPVELPTDLEGKPFLSSRGEILAAAMRGMDPQQAGNALGGAMLSKALSDPAQEEAYTLTPGSARFKGGKQIAAMPAVPEKEPESIRALRVLLGDPALMKAKKELDKAGASNTNINMPYENKWQTATAENDAKRLDALRTSADSARGALRSIQRLRQLNPGAAAGGTAAARTTAANVLAGLGFDIDPKLAASQEFDAIASRMVIDSLGGSLGTGFSNADRDFVTRTVPQIGHSLEARGRLLDFMEGKFNQQVQDYNQADAYARQHQGLQGYNPNPPVTKVYNPVTGQIEDAPQ